jgi:hypothetical protein
MSTVSTVPVMSTVLFTSTVPVMSTGCSAWD